MPTFKLNEDGQLVTAEGEAVEIEGEAVTVEGAKTQADIDKTVNDRLARERAKHTELEKAAQTVPALQLMVDESKATIETLEKQALEIKATAAEESQAQVMKSRQDADKWKKESLADKQRLSSYQSQNELLAAAGDTFVNAMQDVVPRLSGDRKADPVIGEDGKATGETRNLYHVTYKNEEGESVDGYLPADKAVAAIAEANSHLVKSNGASGSGGGNYNQNTPKPKRSTMSDAEKAKYAGDHGEEAFRALPK